MSGRKDASAGKAPRDTGDPRQPRPYSDATHELIIRDHLAIDQTVLENERTFLAYVRTAVALLITGLGIIYFFDDILIQVMGYALILAGIATVIIGCWRYQVFRRATTAARREVGDGP